MFGFWIELEQKKAMWVTKQVYKQRNENGDNQLLEKLFMLFVQDWKLNAIIHNNLLKSRKLARQNSMKTAETCETKFKEKRQNRDSYSKNGKQTYKEGKNVE